MSHAASITLTGRVGSDPLLSSGATGDRVTFRVVATERRLDREGGGWVDGDEFGVRVICWRAMATAVLAIVRKGDPVVVVGRIATRRFDKDGTTQYFTEVKADTIGLDVARIGNRIARKQPDVFGSTQPQPQPQAEPAEAPMSDLGAGDLPPEPDYDDPWGMPEESAERSGELVGSG